ncbi:Serine/threonine-protein phosphatase 7 long form-like protein [Hordeum vulgare]|nr:Serine/threonine-protein phosphatase 7 long form-like protein [Hordeum vulgare]
MRSHTSASKMAYDVRYEPSFENVGLLLFVLQFKRVPSTMNHAPLTSLLDRWRPERHNYGEMTVTLEDFAMITWLPIDDQALIGRMDKKNSCHRITTLISDSSTSLSLRKD